MNNDNQKKSQPMSFMQNSTRLILLVLFTLALSGAYVFLFNTISTGRTKNLELRAQILRQNTTLSETAELRDIILRSEEDRNLINTYFVTKDTINIFFDRLEKLGNDSNVETMIASAKEIPIDGSGKTELEVAITTDGSFEDIYQFMLLLENLPFQIQIIGFESSRSEAQVVLSTPGEGEFSSTDQKEIVTYPWRGKFLIRLKSYLAN